MAQNRRRKEHQRSYSLFSNIIPSFLVSQIFSLTILLIPPPVKLSTYLPDEASLNASYSLPASLPDSLSSLPPITTPSSPILHNDAPTLYTNCSWNMTTRWPPNPKGPTLVLGFLMTRKGDVRERLGLKIPGMISYAVEEVNKKGLPDNYTLQIEVRDTKGDEILSTKHVTDMVCGNISAFIGPETSCWVEASIAEAQNIPMISYACTDSNASKRKTFSRTNPSEIHILRAALESLIFFKWKKFSIIYEKSGFETMAKTLADLAKERDLHLNHFIDFKSEEEFPNIFVRTKDATRIYVLIAHRQNVPKALLAMTLSGLLKAKKKDYFLMYVDREEFLQANWIEYIFEPVTIDKLNMTNECLSKDLQAYEDGFMVVANTLPKNNTIIEDKTREYNKKEPFCLPADVTKILSRINSIKASSTKVHVPFLSASHLYDSVMIYARAVEELYHEMKNRSKVTGEIVDVATIGRNGRAIAEKLINMEFHSILGFNVTIGPDRASEGSYSIYHFQNSNECKKNEYRSKLNCISHCLVKISDFRNHKIETDLKILIKDEPYPCGYTGEGCDLDSDNPRLITFCVLTVSICLIGLFSIQKYRHWKYEQEISGLLWRIDKEELKFSQNEYIGQSKMSIMSGVSQEGNYANYVAFDQRAIYRGTVCCIKLISLDHKKQELLSRETMKNMRSMREIKHRNVCPFIGAYVEERKLTLVTEYANRGSLEDILECEDIKLDELFISSLVQDLLRAMYFLHQSFGPHGNLKSTNCVVTGRWVLQVTDYDLYDLRYEAYKDLERMAEDENGQEERKKHIKSCLWKSPELLRENNFARGTKEGDVYAFGIILHEIIGRKGPFSTSDSNGEPDFESIVEDVKRGSNTSGILPRPNTLDLAMMSYGSDADVLNAMKAAWGEDPKTRPDFKELTARLKKLKKTGNLVDHMVLILEEHNKNLEGLVKERTQEVFEEKKKTEELLHSMLPSSVATNLCRNIPVEPQSYDSVTIYFSDIVGFTALASDSSPYEIVSFLDDLYREFDTTIRGFDVYKVETIGDAYMVVSGLPHKNEGRHAGEIASMSLELLEHTKTFKIKHRPNQILKLRIGLHTGPVISGVVGHTMPRYCLFGDTVNTASRMESNGEPLRIHISEQCNEALTHLGGYIIEERGYVEMKGKGAVLTYWLQGATDGAIRRVEKTGPTVTFFQRLTDDTRDVRRRSPRLSIDLRTGERRTPNLSRPLRNQELNSSFREPIQRDFAYLHRQRLNQNHRTNSLESNVKGGFLSPPLGTPTRDETRTPSTGSVRESHSLDNLPANPSLAVPASRGIRFTPSPSSSEPYLAPEETPRVNFSTRFKTEEGDEAELNPMLDASVKEDSDFDEENRTDSPSSYKRASVMKNFLQSLIPKGKRDKYSSEKSSLNGLQRESHV